MIECDFCAIDFEPAAPGRPARFCSKSCRQHEHRERYALVSLALWRCARRRRDARARAEGERLLAEIEAPTWSDRENARETARARAWDAWPAPGDVDTVADYVAACRGSESVDGVSSR